MFWFSLFHSLSYSSFVCNFPREVSPTGSGTPQLCSSRCSSNAVDKLPKTSRIDFLGEALWHPKYKKGCYKGWLHFGALGSTSLYHLLSELSVPTQLMSKILWDGYWIYLIDWMEHHLSISPILQYTQVACNLHLSSWLVPFPELVDVPPFFKAIVVRQVFFPAHQWKMHRSQIWISKESKYIQKTRPLRKSQTKCFKTSTPSNPFQNGNPPKKRATQITDHDFCTPQTLSFYWAPGPGRPHGVVLVYLAPGQWHTRTDQNRLLMC